MLLLKMSHFHFVAHKKYKKRLLQLGEERWRIKEIVFFHLMKSKRKKLFEQKRVIK